ncbi:MAG: FadR family transcriptional regulator [Rhodobacteraceae bacterium]|nr:FadR family transcriptional regulator [Paracoccaceae bacterium]
MTTGRAPVPEGVKQRKSLAEVVFERMHRAIKSGAYAPDERLPTEHDLAAEFQVSRPVVREALKKLRDQRLIYSRQGAGSFVAQLGVKEPLGFGAVESLADLRRCYEFREVIEPASAAVAAERRTAEDLVEIRRALDVMRDATERRRHREDADYEFHLAIAKATGNQYFWTAMEALKDHIAVGMQFHGMSLKHTIDGLAQVYDEHVSIYESIAGQRPDEARRRMAAHLAGSRERLFEGQGGQ